MIDIAVVATAAVIPAAAAAVVPALAIAAAGVDVDVDVDQSFLFSSLFFFFLLLLLLLLLLLFSLLTVLLVRRRRRPLNQAPKEYNRSTTSTAALTTVGRAISLKHTFSHPFHHHHRIDAPFEFDLGPRGSELVSRGDETRRDETRGEE